MLPADGTRALDEQPGSRSGPRTKVLYVSGWFRSGSTVLGQTLGSIDGFFFGGELRYAWRDTARNELCACGAPYSDCATWQPIMERLRERGLIDRQAVASLDERLLSTRHLRSLIAARGARGRHAAAFEAYRRSLDELYSAVADRTSARVIVDTSKAPTYALALQTIPSLDVYVVHLVRDPRATTFSRLRDSTGVDLGIAGSAVLWSAWNGLASRHKRKGRYLLVRYEDFARRPIDIVRRTLDLLDEPADALPFVDEETVRLGTGHSIAGNRVRSRSGDVRISPDEKWRSELGLGARLVVGTLTWPLRYRYGYVKS
ncbi:MAG: sulfotransferase [Actinomycetota bacterium]